MVFQAVVILGDYGAGLPEKASASDKHDSQKGNALPGVDSE